MSRYTKEHYEDVARLLRAHHLEGNDCDVQDVVRAFADLFATDNPILCIYCGYIKGTTEICDSADGRLRNEHLFEGGFDREQFLAACGLEPEESSDG